MGQWDEELKTDRNVLESENLAAEDSLSLTSEVSGALAELAWLKERWGLFLGKSLGSLGDGNPIISLCFL